MREENPNKDLPEGATKVVGEPRYLLAKLYRRERDFYKNTRGQMINGGAFALEDMGVIESEGIWHGDYGKPTKESKELFNGQLHPVVDGYEFYRGLCVPTSEGRIFIYTPHLFIDESRHYEAFTQGNVKTEELDKTIRTYVKRLTEHMDNMEAGYKKKM